MALSESALSELLASLQAGDGVDLVRELARWALQELIEAEAAAAIGAGRYERSDGRVTERNGHRPRVLSTKAGDLQVGIPKLRAGSFFPSLLEPRRRIDQALYAVVMEAYVAGRVDPGGRRPGRRDGHRHRHLEVRGVADLRRAGRAGRRVPQPHPRPCRVPVRVPRRHLRPRPRRRPRPGRVPGRGRRHRDHRGGDREVLGVDIGDSEDETFWTGFLRSLRSRGLGGVRLVISDAHAGLRAAIRKVSRARRGSAAGSTTPATCWRPSPRRTRDGRRRVPVDLRPADPDEVRARYDEVTDTLAARFPKAAESLRDARTDVLAFPTFPVSTGARSGRTTRSSGSTRRSSDAPTSSGSSPTTPPPSVSSAPSSPTSTTSGPSPAATSPRPPWPPSPRATLHCSARRAHTRHLSHSRNASREPHHSAGLIPNACPSSRCPIIRRDTASSERRHRSTVPPTRALSAGEMAPRGRGRERAVLLATAWQAADKLGTGEPSTCAALPRRYGWRLLTGGRPLLGS